MSKRGNMQHYRRQQRIALKAAGEDVPTQVGHGKQTGWKRELNRKSYAVKPSQMEEADA